MSSLVEISKRAGSVKRLVGGLAPVAGGIGGMRLGAEAGHALAQAAGKTGRQQQDAVFLGMVGGGVAGMKAGGSLKRKLIEGRPMTGRGRAKKAAAAKRERQIRQAQLLLGGTAAGAGAAGVGSLISAARGGRRD